MNDLELAPEHPLQNEPGIGENTSVVKFNELPGLFVTHKVQVVQFLHFPGRAVTEQCDKLADVVGYGKTILGRALKSHEFGQFRCFVAIGP